MSYSTSYKGFIYYDPSSNKFCVSRNVIFFEDLYFFPTHIEIFLRPAPLEPPRQSTRVSQTPKRYDFSSTLSISIPTGD